MPSEQDIELLESYLDGALEPAEIADLRRRIEGEAELSAELQRLETARQLRMQAWQSGEADAASAQRIIANIRARAARRAWYWRLLDHRERIAAAAACIAVFLIGWQWGRNVNAVHMTPAGASLQQPVSLITQQELPTNQGRVFEVRLTDASGKVVRVERFNSMQDAHRFMEELKSQLLRQQGGAK